MNDHAYLYANTSDKSIMYDLAVHCALVEVPPVPGGGLKRILSSSPSPSRPHTTNIPGQVAAKSAAASSLCAGGTGSPGDGSGRGWWGGEWTLGWEAVAVGMAAADCAQAGAITGLFLQISA